jgi:hypothetical protein
MSLKVIKEGRVYKVGAAINDRIHPQHPQAADFTWSIKQLTEWCSVNFNKSVETDLSILNDYYKKDEINELLNSAVIEATGSGTPSYSGNIVGNGIKKQFIVNHNLGTKNILIFCYDDTSNKINPIITKTSVNSIKLGFSEPVDNKYKINFIILAPGSTSYSL